MKQNVSFNLNGKPVEVEVSGEESLLTIIRTYLDHTGTKYGCGMGHCGSCTVLIDKEPVRSCMIYAEDVAGKEITTIEGLAKGEELHPVQKAFVKHDALQCGYCTPGMIMNATGLLLKKPDMTREEIIEGMEENLCRCGSYMRIIDAIQTAGKEMKGGM
jgi:carbon-monoxide dehydrogenase small subunit